MKKILIIIAILLFVGCEKVEVTQTNEVLYYNLKWAVRADYSSFLGGYTIYCYHIDNDDECEDFIDFYNWNNYTIVDFNSYNWTEIRMPVGQLENDYMIELIASNGVVNPVTNIDYVKYLDE